MATATAIEQSEQDAMLIRQAGQEMARRRLIRFCRYVSPYYQASTPHYALAETLEKVERGEINRLIVNFPRRHGKSLLVSQMFPCWALGRNPQLKIVQSGYAQSLTIVHSRKARDILASQKFAEVFPSVHHTPGTEGQKYIATLMQTAHEWGTNQGGNYYAVGVGGGLAGRGYSIGIVDDPIRDRADANSKLKRDKVWDWYRSVFYPAQDSDHIRENAAIVLCMTRWHVDDLAARAQQINDELGDNEKWHILSMPAINDAGEALWPERYPLPKLRRIKNVIGALEFSAQYQQRPSAEEGRQLDSSKLVMIDHDKVPEMIQLVRPWDLAFTDKEDSDFVAGMKMGVDLSGNVYLLDLKRIKGRWNQSSQEICNQAELDGLNCAVGIEANGTQTGYADIIKERVQNRTVVALEVNGNKEMRAAAWGTRLQDKIIYCVRAPWNQVLFDEMEYFPNAEHDDVVDSVSHGWQYLKAGTGFAAVVDQHPNIERVELPRYQSRGRMGLM